MDRLINNNYIREISESAYPDVGFWSGDVADRSSLLSILIQYFSQETDINNDLRWFNIKTSFAGENKKK